MNSLRNFARDPAVLSEVLQRIEEARQPNEPISDPADVQGALLKFDPLWEQLTTGEREAFILHPLCGAGEVTTATTGDVTIGIPQLEVGIKDLCNQPGSSG